MKRISLVGIFSCLFLTMYSQVEIKTDIIKPFTKDYYLAGEYFFTPWWGIDVGFGSENENTNEEKENPTTQQLFELKLLAKYYPFPAEGNDRFFLGPFWKFRQLHYEEFEAREAFGRKDFVAKGIVFGGLIGYKWKSTRSFFAEFTLGGGMKYESQFFENIPNRRTLIIDPHLIVQVQFGFRFGEK